MWCLLFLLGADEVRPRWDREDCILEPGECYGLDVLQNCKLGPGICFRFGIEEVEPPPPPRPPYKPTVQIRIYAPCAMDPKDWAATRLPPIQKAYEAYDIALAYGACDSAKPRIDVIR